MAADVHIVLLEGQFFARRDANLQMDQVEAGDQFRHGMLHLQARVHLQEIKVLLLIDQELDRAGVGVGRGLRDADCNLAHPAPHAGVDDRRRGFFKHLLMAALQRAFALAEVDGVAVLVGEHLHLDVPRIDDSLLDVNFAVAESAFRLAAGCFQRRLDLIGSVHQPHAFAAAARRRLQHHRIADSRGHLLCLIE